MGGAKLYEDGGTTPLDLTGAMIDLPSPYLTGERGGVGWAARADLDLWAGWTLVWCKNRYGRCGVKWESLVFDPDGNIKISFLQTRL